MPSGCKMSPQARVNDKEGTENYEQTVSTSGGDSQQVGEDETPVSPRDSDSNQASIEPREPSTEKFVYRDFSSRETDRAGRSSSPNSTIRVQKLPAKLNAMLSNPNFSHIISWMPHGRAWKVHNAHAFVEEVVPRYFEYTNYNSFIRLVNAWGFRRLLKGPDRNSYYHEVSISYPRIFFPCYSALRFQCSSTAVSSRHAPPSRQNAQAHPKREKGSS